VDNDPRAWAHRISIKRMSPTPGIKFSLGLRPQVKAFLLLLNIDLKNRTFKWLTIKIVNRSVAHIKGPRHPLIGFFDTLFSRQFPFKQKNFASAEKGFSAYSLPPAQLKDMTLCKRTQKTSKVSSSASKPVLLYFFQLC
jgi:hypothetical protein